MDNNNEFSYSAAPENGTNDNSGSQTGTYGTQTNAYEAQTGAYTGQPNAYGSQNMNGTQTNTYGSQNTNGTQTNAYGSQNMNGTQTNTYGPQNMNGGQTNAYGSQSVNGGQTNAYGNQSTNGTQPNGYGTQGMPYNQTSPYQSPYSSSNQNVYRAAMGQPQQKAPKEKKKREKKPGGFGATLGKCAAIAVVFGLVGGGIFTGVSYAGVKALGISTQVSAEASGGSGTDGSQSGSSAQQTSSNVESTSTGKAKDIVSVSDIVDEVMPGIVAITNTSVVTYQSFFGGTQQYEAESCGSGIIIKQDSDYLYIATNNHVVSGAETLSVQFFNDVSVSGEIQGTYASSDLAVVKVALKDIDSDTLSQIRQVTIGDSDSLKVGEGTIAIGNALGYGQSVTTGIVSALNRSITVQDETTGASTTCDNLIQTDAAINPGNSGGALLDSTGALIGINSAKYADTDVEGIGYAIPINDAMEIINALIAGESLEKTQTAYLGIGGGDVSSDVASAYGLPQGVYVKSVYEGSGAADAGICQGDIITGIDGTELTSMSELQTLLMNYSAGDTVTLTVWRMNNGYQSMEVKVTLTDASVLENTDTSSDNSGSSNGGSSNGSNDQNGNGYGNNDNGFGNFDFGFGW
jgi:serine protease Do